MSRSIEPCYYEDADQIWLEQQLVFESETSNAIAVTPNPMKWHPVLIPLRDQLGARTVDLERRKREYEAEQRRYAKKGSSGPNLAAINYGRTGHDTGMLVPHHHKSAFRVTTLTCNRATAIANAILIAAEARGCTVGYCEYRGRLAIKLEDAELYLAIRERQDHKIVTGSYGNEKIYTPTDKIAIAVDKSHGGMFELIDKKTSRVENQLNELFVRLYATVIVSRAASRQRKVEDERLAVERAAFEEITRQRAIQAKVHISAHRGWRFRLIVDAISA